MNEPKRFALTPLERQSSAWLNLQRHLNDRLAVARSALEGDLDEKKTTQHRARIAVLKELLALGEPEPNEANLDA